MLILVCGLPSAGKTTVVITLASLAGVEPIRPESLIPQNVVSLGVLAKELWDGAESVCLEKVSERLADIDKDDVCVIELNSMNQEVSVAILQATKVGHKVALIYVNASSAVRKVRPGYNPLLEAGLADTFIAALPTLKKMCTKFVLLNNDATLHDLIELTRKTYASLHQ